MASRFQRIGMNQEMMMRARPPSNFPNQPQLVMSPTGHYNVSRVPFPSQSPTGSTSLRSPSPMIPMGNMPMGSPPNQVTRNKCKSLHVSICLYNKVLHKKLLYLFR